MTFKNKAEDGINFTSIVANTNLNLETMKTICSEYRIHNADISLWYDATADDLIDVIEGSRIYMPCIYAVNKIDQITLEELEILDKLPHYCPVRYHQMLVVQLYLFMPLVSELWLISTLLSWAILVEYFCDFLFLFYLQAVLTWNGILMDC